MQRTIENLNAVKNGLMDPNAAILMAYKDIFTGTVEDAAKKLSQVGDAGFTVTFERVPNPSNEKKSVVKIYLTSGSARMDLATFVGKDLENLAVHYKAFHGVGDSDPALIYLTTPSLDTDIKEDGV